MVALITQSGLLEPGMLLQEDVAGLDADVAAVTGAHAAACEHVHALLVRLTERLRYEDAEVEVDRRQAQVPSGQLPAGRQGMHVLISNQQGQCAPSTRLPQEALAAMHRPLAACCLKGSTAAGACRLIGTRFHACGSCC